MSVNDHGLEALRRAAEYLTEGNKAETIIRVKALLSGSALAGVDWDHFSGAQPSPITEVYTFKLGGSGGVTKAIITVVYATAAKDFITTCDITKY